MTPQCGAVQGEAGSGERGLPPAWPRAIGRAAERPEDRAKNGQGLWRAKGVGL